jgi:eukaryotic-like serine/threonine-protein kinase
MTPSRWEKVKLIFHAALEANPSTRAAYIKNACEGDPELYAEVTRLLRESEKTSGFLGEAPFASASMLSPGQLVAGRYRISRLLGRGGMGEVYEAQDQLLAEAIALKTLRPDLAGDESVLRRFQREIHTARRVTHPNVCRIFEVGIHESGGRAVHFFTMELLAGETLSSRIRRLGRLTRAEAFPIAAQMAEGLAAAHKAGVVHRDFKSGNVILVESAAGPPIHTMSHTRAVITDFGMARVDASLLVPDATVTMTDERVLAGTVAYMAPEQLTGGAVTAASDIYSFGIVLFEMAAGTRPFDDSHLIRAAVQRVSGETARRLRSLTPNIDARWEAAIVRCLERDPRRRFRSAAELAGWFREDRLRFPTH